MNDAVCAPYGHGPTLGAVPSPNPEHTPVRSIRMDDETWGELGDVAGERNRSAVINELVRWYLGRGRAPKRPHRGQ